MDGVEPGEVHVAAIHHIIGTRLWNQNIEDLDIMHFSFGNIDEFRDAASDVEQSVQFDGGLGPAKSSPWKQSKAQVDGSGVERVDGGFLKLGAEVLIGIERSGLSDEDLREVGIDTPVTLFIGVGQSAPGDVTADSHVVQLRSHCSQADFDITETIAIAQLSERHA